MGGPTVSYSKMTAPARGRVDGTQHVNLLSDRDLTVDEESHRAKRLLRRCGWVLCAAVAHVEYESACVRNFHLFSGLP